jgi:hypothetical protein
VWERLAGVRSRRSQPLASLAFRLPLPLPVQDHPFPDSDLPSWTVQSRALCSGPFVVPSRQRSIILPQDSNLMSAQESEIVA